MAYTIDEKKAIIASNSATTITPEHHSSSHPTSDPIILAEALSTHTPLPDGHPPFLLHAEGHAHGHHT